MEGSSFDELAFFDAIAKSGARALLIGRRALVLLGLPVLTADYDFWVHPEDIGPFNEAAARYDLHAGRPAEELRARGRYVLEDDEKVDVLVAASVTTVDGAEVRFDGVWSRRRTIELAGKIPIAIPSIDDLIATKRFTARPKDLEDVRLLETLRRYHLEAP